MTTLSWPRACLCWKVWSAVKIIVFFWFRCREDTLGERKKNKTTSEESERGTCWKLAMDHRRVRVCVCSIKRYHNYLTHTHTHTHMKIRVTATLPRFMRHILKSRLFDTDKAKKQTVATNARNPQSMWWSSTMVGRSRAKRIRRQIC